MLMVHLSLFYKHVRTCTHTHTHTHTQMDFIFDSELCAEEQEWIEKLDALQREEEEEEAMRGSPLANRREMESKIQKGTAWEFYTTCKSTTK